VCTSTLDEVITIELDSTIDLHVDGLLKYLYLKKHSGACEFALSQPSESRLTAVIIQIK
jgi:hypothetical protein